MDSSIDPTVVHSFAAVGGASSLYVASILVRGLFRVISAKRADASQEKRSASAELEDLKEAYGKLSEAVERLKALAEPHNG